MNNKLTVRLLGKFDVSRYGKDIAITSRPAQSLFAYLILSAGTSHRREKLQGFDSHAQIATWAVEKRLMSTVRDGST